MQKLQQEYTGKGVVWLSDRFLRARDGGKSNARAGRENQDGRLENKIDRVAARSGGQSRPGLRREEHAAHVRHQSGRQNRLRRRDRQQSHTKSGRHPELDQLREGRARRIAGRQAGHDGADQTVRLLG